MKYMKIDISEVIFKVVFRVTLVRSHRLAKGRIVSALDGPVAKRMQQGSGSVVISMEISTKLLLNNSN